LLGEAGELIALNPGLGCLRLFTQAFCPFSKTLIERRLFSETAALLHGAVRDCASARITAAFGLNHSIGSPAAMPSSAATNGNAT
jgi:hypothetical protein